MRGEQKSVAITNLLVTDVKYCANIFLLCITLQFITVVSPFCHSLIRHCHY